VQMLVKKCRAAVTDGKQPLSNSDNMAVVGILSTLLVQKELVQNAKTVPAYSPPLPLAPSPAQDGAH